MLIDLNSNLSLWFGFKIVPVKIQVNLTGNKHMHINWGVRDASQVLILACVALKYELKISFNFGTLRF